MNSHISALAQTLMIYMIMAVACLGWGRAATRVLGLSEQTGRFSITLIWLGWAVTLGVFQLIHLFFALTAYLVAPVLIIGTAFSIPKISKILLGSKDSRVLMEQAGIVVIMLAGASWIASRSMLSPGNYDSGLYHFNMIRWINVFPIVPGLGNLHGRLAFNQSFFTYVAALNLYPFFGHGRSLANSFIFLLAMATFMVFLHPVLKKPASLIEAHPFEYGSILLALPILGHLALSKFSDGLASPSPDFASNVLQLVMFVILAQDIAEWIKGNDLEAPRAPVGIILAATAITIKLSNLAFSTVIIGIYLLGLFWSRSSIRTECTIRLTLLIAVVMLVWITRGYILSGAPLYPSTVGYVSVGWAVPIQAVVNEANWVYSWARQPGTHWSIVLNSWNWLSSWMTGISMNIWVLYPVMLSGAFYGITMALLLISKRTWFSYPSYIILLPVVVGLIYWFFTAPDPRFAGVLFSCLALSSALLLLISIQQLVNKRVFLGFLCIIFIMANLHFILYAIKWRHQVKDISTSGWHSIKTVELVQRETSSGLVVFTPEQGDQCWDAPLPCTPYFNPDLRLHTSGELASGFYVTQ